MSSSSLKRKSSNLVQMIRKKFRGSRRDSTKSSGSVEPVSVDRERTDSSLSLERLEELQPAEFQPRLEPNSHEEPETILENLPATTSVSHRREKAVIPCLTVIDTSSEKDSLTSRGSSPPSDRSCPISASDSGLYSEAEEDDLLDVFCDDVCQGDWLVNAQDLSLDALLVTTPQETIYR